MVDSKKTRIKDYGLTRYDAYPHEIDKLKERKYYAYDVLSIFAHLLDINATYNRFDFPKAQNFVEYIQKQEWSLYQQMFNSVTTGKEHVDSGVPTNNDYHQLLSDATIRIFEVQNAIISELKRNRIDNKYRDNAEASYKIKMLFQTIQNLGIQIYPIGTSTSGYHIDFKFLTPIIEYLSKEYTSDFEGVLILPSTLEKINQKTLPDIEIKDALISDMVLRHLTYPITGQNVKEIIKVYNSALWQKGMVISPRFWTIIFPSSASYSNLDDIYKVLYANALKLSKIVLDEDDYDEIVMD